MKKTNALEKYYEELCEIGSTYCDDLEVVEHLQRWVIENMKSDPITNQPIRRVRYERRFFMDKWRYWVFVSVTDY